MRPALFHARAAAVLLIFFSGVGLAQDAGRRPPANHPSAGQLAFLQQNKPGNSAKEVDWSAFLPPGQGQMQVGSYCTTCHDLKTVVSDRRADAEGWKQIVEDMVLSKGAPAPEEDIPVMANYLAKHFGPATPKLTLPVAINTAPKEILALLPGLTDEEVQKLLDARKNASIKDSSGLETIIGKERTQKIKDVISFEGESKKS